MAVTSMETAVKAASLNVVVQISFRFGMFLMNAVLLRHISREVLGIANVRLMLLHSTILFLSREAVRKACLTKTEGILTSRQLRIRMVNLIWLSIAGGLLVAFPLSLLWIFIFEQPSKKYLWQYKVSVIGTSLSAIMELLVEPLWIYGQKFSFVKTKAVLEGIFLTTRCTLTVILVVLFPHFQLHSFSIAFIFATLLYTCLYYGYFYYYIKVKEKKADFPFHHMREFLPNLTIDKPFIDSYYLQLTQSFYKQSLLKQFLSEGERYVMTFFNILNFGQQGVFDVVNNLGSLAARLLFMPIEESYYTFFSQILGRETAKNQKLESIKTSSEALSVVLKFVSLVGFTILVFGYSYSTMLLHLYGGTILSSGEGPLLLKTYCCYVLLLAINGITECFMIATMSQEEVDKYNYKMLLFSVLFLSASLIFTKIFGPVGLIIANAFNMLLRIIQSCTFIQKFFKSTSYNPLGSSIPSIVTLTVISLCGVCTKISEQLLYFSDGLYLKILHLFIGGVCFLIVLITVYVIETELVNFTIGIIKKRKIS